MPQRTKHPHRRWADRLTLAAGRILGTMAYILDGNHRRIARRNLRFACPDCSLKTVRRTSRQAFCHFGVTVLEILRLKSMEKKTLLSKIRISGEQHIQTAIEHPRGAIIVSGHIGNWEMALLFAACYLDRKVTAVARPIDMKWLDRWMRGLRSRFGNNVVDKDGALSEMMKALRRGELVGILVDQVTKKADGVAVEFFGRTVSATPAAALLALRCGSPVLPVFCTRDPEGALTLHVDPPVSIHKTGRLREDLRENTQRITDAIEKGIRRSPEQWFWFHKRWKRFYPALYPEYQDKRKRKRERELREMGEKQ